MLSYHISEQIFKHNKGSSEWTESIDIWDDAIRHKLFVSFPVLAVPARGSQQRERNEG
jgi:hypothetical protein